ncbi:hypothetical protein [Frisingicoccus sp.]|uniref:hypothetical protein n=1 Tax=Frisingicoccus sp. TaxID=1918627 RepID=UPI003869D9F1
MSNQDFVDEAFYQFVQQFHTEEQKVLLAFYRELVGKRKIPYKIKDRSFSVNIQMCQGFAIDVEFQDVLIEDGRHPKEIFMENLRGERLDDGRYRMSFTNRLAASSEGQAPKESAFSFSSVRGGVHLWDYSVHTMKLENDTRDIPWYLIYGTLQAIQEKKNALGSSALNTQEEKALWIFRFLRPYLQLFLSPATKIGFGKSTVLYLSDEFDGALDHSLMQEASDFFASLGMKRLSDLFARCECTDKELIQELLYTMRSLKGNILFKTLKQLIDECGKQYQGLYECDKDMNRFRSYIREKVQKIFSDHGWKGTYPSYMLRLDAEFLEVSSVYKRQYAYLNEKTKFIYFDFIESVVDGQYHITPVTGMILPKNSNIDYRKCTSMDCFFFDGGRRNGAVIGDLTVSESMTVNTLREKMKQLSAVLDIQTK